MRKKQLILTGSLIIAASLGLTGCNAADSIPGVQSPPTVENTSPGATNAPTNSGQPDDVVATPADLHKVTIAALAAIDLAESTTGGVAYQLSDDDDESRWEVELRLSSTEVEAKVSWDGTQFISQETDDDLDSDTLRKLDTATLTIQDAIKTASPHAGGYVDDAELDEEDGVVIWEIQFQNNNDDDSANNTDEWEVYVDAQTGEIISVETH